VSALPLFPTPLLPFFFSFPQGKIVVLFSCSRPFFFPLPRFPPPPPSTSTVFPAPSSLFFFSPPVLFSFFFPRSNRRGKLPAERIPQDLPSRRQGAASGCGRFNSLPFSRRFFLLEDDQSEIGEKNGRVTRALFLLLAPIEFFPPPREEGCLGHSC